MKEPVELLVEQDFDEIAKKVNPVPSEWDRIYRVLKNMFEKLQDIQKTQVAQCDVAKETCARLTILEGKIK